MITFRVIYPTGRYAYITRNASRLTLDQVDRLSKELGAIVEIKAYQPGMIEGSDDIDVKASLAISRILDDK